MKKLTLLRAWTVIFIGPLATVSAQPVLTNSNISPYPGEYYVGYLVVPPIGQLLNATGANQTWDFSGVLQSNGYIFGNFAPNMTQFGTSYPNATVTCQLPQYGTNLVYMQSDSNELVELGINDQIWNNPRTMLRFPLTYLDTFTDTGTYYSGSLNWIWHVSGVADGYGTIILPYGTVNNVLRVREDVDNWTGQGWVSQLTYSWYQPGTHTPICRYWTDFMDDFFHYRTPFSTGMNPLAENSGGRVYPNPFSDQVVVYIPEAPLGDALLQVFDMSGKLMHHEFVNAAPHKSFSVQLGDLSKGNYILELCSDETVYHFKVMKQ